MVPRIGPLGPDAVRGDGAASSPTASSRSAADCRCRGCSTPTGAASSRGSTTAIRCCGGVPIRGWSCRPTACTSRGRWPAGSRRRDVTVTADTAFADGGGRLRRAARRRPAHLDHADDAPGLRRARTRMAPPTRWRCGSTASWPAASTAWRSAGRSSASRCSRGSPTARRSRSSTWPGSWPRWGVPFIDCQVRSDHLVSLGARELPRREFLRRIAGLVDLPAIPSPWRLDPDLPDRVAERRPPGRRYWRPRSALLEAALAASP